MDAEGLVGIGLVGALASAKAIAGIADVVDEEAVLARPAIVSDALAEDLRALVYLVMAADPGGDAIAHQQRNKAPRGGSGKILRSTLAAGLAVCATVVADRVRALMREDEGEAAFPLRVGQLGFQPLPLLRPLVEVRRTAIGLHQVAVGVLDGVVVRAVVEV